MRQTPRALRGMVTAPHALASQAGLAVLRDGGNAVEAMVAAAATIAVVYPHMNSIGGDGFWLIHEPGEEPVAIAACGGAAALADRNFYRQQDHARIPSRGGPAALTAAGTVDGWREALTVASRWGNALPLPRLLEEAIHHARHGIAVTASQARLTREKLPELRDQPGFGEVYLQDGEPPAEGAILQQPRLADTLARLSRAGLEDFYRGELARDMAADLEKAGSPLRLADLENYRAARVKPLQVTLPGATAYNLPPPTQGLASLMILGIFVRLDCPAADGYAHVHGLVEATKQVFLVRDRYLTDPAYMEVEPGEFLSTAYLAEAAAAVHPARALPWPQSRPGGDTIWMGAADRDGRMVSFIQSVYWEFGSGVVLPGSGVCWQNRGISFSLEDDALQALRPGRLPFHTLNPALARFRDGRTLVYGTMGGEGQPQTQAAVFSRYARFQQSLQQAVSAPRWLLGRTWGEQSTGLKLEARFPGEVLEGLRAAGHTVEVVEDFSDTMGHAGAIALRPDGVLEGATDPRADGVVAAY